jgi:hypothetical protein
MQDEKKLPLELAHGCNIWDLASQDPTLNIMFNDATKRETRRRAVVGATSSMISAEPQVLFDRLLGQRETRRSGRSCSLKQDLVLTRLSIPLGSSFMSIIEIYP